MAIKFERKDAGTETAVAKPAPPKAAGTPKGEEAASATDTPPGKAAKTEKKRKNR